MTDGQHDSDAFVIPMDGLHNLRTVAGYVAADGRRMRAGRLYRSGAWERMSDRDRAWFAENIETVLDLRHPDEVAGAAAASLGEPPATLIRHSVFRPEVSMAAFVAELNGLSGPAIGAPRYLSYLQIGGAERLARAVEMLAEERRYPVLVNCTAGKDRTGVLVALVMALLGVADDAIAAEYERSNAAVDGLIRYLEGVGRHPTGNIDEIRARMRVHADTMLDFLTGIRAQHGSVRGLLEGQGVADATFAALGDRLLA